MEANELPVTYWLQRFREGDAEAEAILLDLLYEQLRRLAHAHMRKERDGKDHTLPATALVHEAYLRLAKRRDITWQNRAHFLAVASNVMRRLLVDHARARKAARNGGGTLRVELRETAGFCVQAPEDVLALDEALLRLSELDPRGAKIVEMRFFGGLTESEIAELLEVNVRTVKRDWAAAKAWLYGALTSAVTKEQIGAATQRPLEPCP